MNLINAIPIGKEFKKNRDTIMKKAGIYNVNDFKEKLAQLKKMYIIIYDEGYYLPKNKEEYLEFIEKKNSQINEIKELINMANKEMEVKEYV